jgi:hypothetical protein
MSRPKKVHFGHGDRVRVTAGRNSGKFGRVRYVHEVMYDYHKNHYGNEAVIDLDDGGQIEIPVDEIERGDVIEQLGQIAEKDE